MLKRICAFCLIIVLTASLVTALPVSAASAVDSQLLSDLGIIDISDNTGLIPKGFSLGDFARSLCLMARIDNGIEISKEESAEYASDIADNANRNYIAAVLKFGYMETDSEGKFNPGKSLSLEEAITALIKMLGYEPVALENGGSYEAYYSLAVKLKLLSGVSVENDMELTADETADILTNAMSAKLLMPEGIHYGEDCLWDRWDIYEYSGRILANSNMGLLTDSVAANRVNIDGTIYYTELLIENELVGSTVTYYTMNTDKGREVVSIFVENSSDTITLKPEDIASVTDSGSILTVKTEDNKSIKVDKKGFLIVNGKAISPSKAMFDALDSGSATFVDSDNNGIYEVVHMTLLFQTVLEGVNPDTETLATRYDGQIIDFTKLDNYEVFLGKKTAELSDLVSGMPVGIACDAFEITNGELTISPTEAKYIRLHASSRQETGYITEMLDDRFAIEDMTKHFGSGYARLVKGGHLTPLQAGLYVTAYYDNMGELTYYEVTSGGNLEYGYLIATATGESSLSPAARFKILGTDGKINIYSTGNSFILDGTKVTSGSTTYTVNTTDDVDLKKRQVIRFRAQDSVLREIDTMVIRSAVEDEASTLDEVLAFDTTKDGNAKLKIRSGSIDRKFAFTKDCIMFIDEADTNEVNPPENRFSVLKASSLGNEDCYIAGYDANPDNELSCVVRYDGYGLSGAQTKRGLGYHICNCYIVEKIRNCIDGNGNLGWNITLAGDSKKVTHFVAEDNIKLYTTRTAADWNGETVDLYREEAENFTNVIKTGDIVRFQTNAAGNITYIEKMFDFTSHKDTFAEVPDKSGQVYGFAQLEKISGTNIIYSYGGEKSYVSKATTKIPSVSLYHVSTGKVDVMPVSEIPSLATGNNVKCFLRYYNYGIVMDNIFYIYD